MKKINVLFVDDGPSMHELVKAILQDHPEINLVHAYHGVHAWQLIRNLGVDFDIVVTDKHMPHMDGLELAKKVRKQFPNTTVVLISDDEREPGGHEAHAFIPKPFGSGDFYGRLLSLIMEVGSAKPKS